MAVPEFLVWQLADSAFPTGGFAHSWGLEAAWQSGEVADVAALRRFLESSLSQAGRGGLPLLSAAYREPARLAELDRFCDVFIVNPVANRASRVQGRALAATAARVWPEPALLDVAEITRGGCGHVAPVFGAVWSALGVPLATSQQAYLYSAARGVLAAAVRLGIAGSYDAQRLQSDCTPVLARVLDCCQDLGVEDVAQTAPVLDLLQAAHDRLYSRLFQS